jgi:opacity protein-like surface antigen
MRFRPVPLGLLLFFTLLTSAPVWADGFIAPFIGDNVGGNAGKCTNITSCSSTHLTYGVAVGAMSAGVIGVEEDIGFAPSFFGKVPQFGNNSLFTAMTNLIIAAPIGPVHPYVSGGGGLVHTNVLAPSSLDAGTHSSFGYDVGGGVMATIAPHIGIRADYRYIRTTKDFSLGDFAINNQPLNFSRATVGVVIRF